MSDCIFETYLQAQVGVGIVFQADALGALAVKSLAVGGTCFSLQFFMMLVLRESTTSAFPSA